ncbi:MAG TPA: hypothetical protein VHZ95_17860, partial [Polyangiales bacterium]|nr:hypothetical protein [Polyangiales bacterium]
MMLALAGCAKDVTSSNDQALKMVQLPDDVAGKACRRDADCVSGSCVTTLHIQGPDAGIAAGGGYCTAACTDDSDCGRSGSCSVARDLSQGECLATCAADSDCRTGYVCVDAGAAFGRTLRGTCQPRPQT